MWVAGQMVLWAGFQIITVPFVLAKGLFHMVELVFSVYTLSLLCLAVVVWLYRRKTVPALKVVKEADSRPGKWCLFLWVVFGLLLVLQLVLAVLLAYEEGDDAFYVAVSTITASSNTMYQKLPYTGGTTGMDIRHGLAPFPIWISYLAKMSGIEAVTIAQILLPMVLLVMTYAIYYQVGKLLLGKRKEMLPLFMVLMEVLVLFGGYSTYSAENFLLVRAAQGKAVLGNVIIPFLFLQFIVLLEKMQKEEKITMSQWMTMALTMIAGCLCSTLSPLLTCMLVGITGLCTAFCYKKWKILCPMVLCCVVPVGFALLYFVCA